LGLGQDLIFGAPCQRKHRHLYQKSAILPEAYRKAHKSYVLASGLLASWELLGITLQIKEKWGIKLKSPNAVPEMEAQNAMDY